jgi:hypothetical protein
MVRPWALAAPLLVIAVSLPLLRPLRHPESTEISEDEAARLATICALVENAPHPGDPPAFKQAIDARQFPDLHNTIFAQDHLSTDLRVYSDQPPVLAFLLSAPYRVLHHLGFVLKDNSVLVPYLLTLFGSTLPAAATAGLVYRMGRLFELPRPLRTLLSAACVFGGGLICYATVINSHAPAAALTLGAVGCLMQMTVSREPTHSGGWLVAAGFCAALAAMIDPAALIPFVLLLFVVPLMPWTSGLRVIGSLLYVLGAAPPIALHAILTVPITGDMLPGFCHPELAATHIQYVADDYADSDAEIELPDVSQTDANSPGVTQAHIFVGATQPIASGANPNASIAPPIVGASPADPEPVPRLIAAGAPPSSSTTRPANAVAATEPATTMSSENSMDNAAPPDVDETEQTSSLSAAVSAILRWFNRVALTMVGGHGMLDHFPALAFGGIGVTAILRRHWPRPTRALAWVTLASILLLIIIYAAAAPPSRMAMFGNRYLIVLSPLTMYWAGAWLRRKHSPLAWSIAGALLALSVTAGIIGATYPMPPEGYRGYSLIGPLRGK